MTKKYLTLQKKFQEVETQLADIGSLQPDSTPTLYLVHCHVEMSQRLEFLRSLLSAEIASDPSRPQHLRHMSKRLDQLEHRFHEWGNSTMTTSPSGLVDHVDHINGGDDNVRDVDVDAGSSCSCTESCLYDDGDAADEGSVVDFKDLPVVVFTADRNENTTAAEMAETAAVEEEGLVKLVDGKCSSEEKVETKSGGGGGNGRGGVGVGMMCGAVATGWVLGMVSMGLVMVVALSSHGFLFPLGGDHYGNFLTPT